MEDWYMWLNLTKEGNTLVENHHEIRAKFRELGKRYEHLQIHDGDFDPVPDGIMILASRSIPSSRYCMAKTTAAYRSELDSLKNDLVKESLETRVIGPTNSPMEVQQYGDNFKLHEIVRRRSGLYF
jgi:hypothetical protein